MRLMYLDPRYVNLKRLKYLTELYYIKLVKYFYLNKDISIFIDILEDQQFVDFLFKKVFYILQNIKYNTTIGHTTNCIITASFNIVCKYSLDYYFSYNETECPNYSKLEFNILDDIKWKL